VEAAGIAPASRDPLMKASTCLADSLIVGLDSPISGVTLAYPVIFLARTATGG
jgi:hypothetical protein